MIEILGAALGFAARLAPELLKLFTLKADQKHELAMLDKQIALDTLRGQQELALQAGERDLAQIQGGLAALHTAIRTQFTKTGIRFVDALTWLVRPLTTYLLLALYAAAKIAALVLAAQSEGWMAAIVVAYSEEDRALLSSILSFWFLGRVLDKQAGR